MLHFYYQTNLLWKLNKQRIYSSTYFEVFCLSITIFCHMKVYPPAFQREIMYILLQYIYLIAIVIRYFAYKTHVKLHKYTQVKQ